MNCTKNTFLRCKKVCKIERFFIERYTHLVLPCNQVQEYSYSKNWDFGTKAVKVKQLRAISHTIDVYIVKTNKGPLSSKIYPETKNALLLAQLHTKVYHLWKFGHNPFIGVGGVAHTRLSYGRTDGRPCANLNAHTLCVGGIKYRKSYM